MRVIQGYCLQVSCFRGQQWPTFLRISNAWLVTAVHVKMKLGDNTLKFWGSYEICDQKLELLSGENAFRKRFVFYRLTAEYHYGPVLLHFWPQKLHSKISRYISRNSRQLFAGNRSRKRFCPQLVPMALKWPDRIIKVMYVCMSSQCWEYCNCDGVISLLWQLRCL